MNMRHLIPLLIILFIASCNETTSSQDIFEPVPELDSANNETSYSHDHLKLALLSVLYEVHPDTINVVLNAYDELWLLYWENQAANKAIKQIDSLALKYGLSRKTIAEIMFRYNYELCNN